MAKRVVARSLDIATALMKANIAAERHCYRTAVAFLDAAEALIDGRDDELDQIYDQCNQMSHAEHAADVTGYIA